MNPQSLMLLLDFSVNMLQNLVLRAPVCLKTRYILQITWALQSLLKRGPKHLARCPMSG